MLMGLLVFLIGCLVIAVIVYVFHLVLDMLSLPPPIKQIALIIVALIALVCLLILVVHVMSGGEPTVIRLDAGTFAGAASAPLLPRA